MTWVKAADFTPPENEPVLIHDDGESRMVVGRYIKGRWYVENRSDGRLREVAGVTHWAWILDSQTYDSADD